MRQWHQYQWHYMTKRVMLHLISIILTEQMLWCHLLCHLWSHDADGNDIKWPERWCSISFYLDLTNELLPLRTLFAWCDTDTSIMTLHDQKSYVAHCFSHFDLMNTVLLLTMTFALHMLMWVPKVQNAWKSHVASHFNHLELANAVVLLMMPSVSRDASTGITWPKCQAVPCFNHISWANKVVLLTMLSVSCDAGSGSNSITLPKESCHTLFKLSSTEWCLWWCS